jgi:transcriptional regulator
VYIPPLFREDRKEVLHALMGQHSLAALVTITDEGLVANHIPLLLHPNEGPHGILRGHMARANQQWQGLREEPHALAIFQGATAYITPSWYATKEETGKVVPTYNYAVVHAHGPLRVVEDLDQLEQHVRALTDFHEARQGTKWKVDDAPHDFIRRQLKNIVGIEMRIAKLAGKWKVSQNRLPADRAGAAHGLRERGGEQSAAMAGLIDLNSPLS